MEKHDSLEGYDPTLSLQAFEHIRQLIECTFAAASRVWGAPPWDATKNIEANVRSAIPAFRKFLEVGPDKKLAGYVITAPGEKYGSTLEKLSETVRRTLRCLSDNDPGNAHTMDQDLLDPTWEFEFGGEHFHVVTFAPCYRADSSRYAHGQDAVPIFFQPRFAFHAANMARGENLPPRLRIRETFANNGRPYYREDITGTNLEAPRYVKPLTQTDPIVEWWKEKPSVLDSDA